MSYIQKDLLDGERIVYTGKLHWFIYVPCLTFLLLSVVLFCFAHQNHIFAVAGEGALIWTVCLFIKEAIVRMSTELAVTNKRVIFKKGLISRQTMELNHSKIESIREEQGILDRLFDCGTVVLEGTGGGKEYLQNIDAPLTFKKQAQSAADPANAVKQ